MLLRCPIAHSHRDRRRTGTSTSSHKHFLAHVKWVPVLNAGLCGTNWYWELEPQTHAGGTTWKSCPQKGWGQPGMATLGPSPCRHAVPTAQPQTGSWWDIQN